MPQDFYETFAPIALTVFGLWLVVVEVRHAEWMHSPARRRRAYGVSLHFVLPGMMARGSGTIINVCSTASITAYPDGGSYCIAKHALHGFSRTLREEMKPHGIRVVSLLPGATLTASWEGVDLPPERFMPAVDVAEMAWAVHGMSPRTVVEEILMRPFLGDIGS